MRKTPEKVRRIGAVSVRQRSGGQWTAKARRVTPSLDHTIHTHAEGMAHIVGVPVCGTPSAFERMTDQRLGARCIPAAPPGYDVKPRCGKFTQDMAENVQFSPAELVDYLGFIGRRSRSGLEKSNGLRRR